MPMFMRDMSLKFSFRGMSLSGFGFGVMLVS